MAKRVDFELAPGPYWLTNARIPACLYSGSASNLHLEKTDEGLLAADILIEDGRVAAIEAPSQRDGQAHDLAQGQVWPGFVDMHTHLDKGHIWPRQPNPDGTFMGALTSVLADSTANWSAEDVHARISFSLANAYAHGTTAIRTHLDSAPPQDSISWPVFEKLRDEWADRITLQAVSLFSIDRAADAEYLNSIADQVASAGGVLGTVSFPIDDLDPCLRAVFDAAASRGLDLDFHVDETLDPNSLTLETIANIALETKFKGQIVCGHCCSLSVQQQPVIERMLAKLADANIGIVSLPMCNLYLQDRSHGRTPRNRGITIISELQAAGINVAIASDNTRDPFYAYGDLDGLEVFREAVRIGHLDHPIGDAPTLISSNPAKLIGLPDQGAIKLGTTADLILFRGRTYTELLSRPESNRIVLRRGKTIDQTLPDYAELDAIVGAA